MSTNERLVSAARARLVRIRLRMLLSPAGSPRHWIATLLAIILGFGIVAAWHSSHSGSAVSTARPEQLLSLLDNLSARQQRLEDEQQRLMVTREQLQAGSKQAALRESRLRLNALRVLAGTTRVTGSGAIIHVDDPDLLIPSSMILDAIEELRDAGAEALSVNRIRVVSTTWFTDTAAGGISVSGSVIKPPYVIAAIGDPHTLTVALGIPGGVVDSLRAAGAQVRVGAARHLTLAPTTTNR